MPDPGKIFDIVVTDSQPVTRFGLACLVNQDSRFRVVAETSNSLEIAKLCRHFKPAAVILGLPFPELSALKIIRDVKAASDETRILALGTYAERDMIALLMHSGIDALLNKHVPLEQITAALDTVLDGNTYFNPDAMAAAAMGRVNGRQTRRRINGYRELTRREREIFLLIAQTLDTKAIAGQLKISTKTVENHRRRIMRKLGVKRTAEIVRYAAALSMVA